MANRKRKAAAESTNEYLPTLMRMHERWDPDQIAQAITMAEAVFRKPISAYLVMQLAKMPQKTMEKLSPDDVLAALKILKRSDEAVVLPVEEAPFGKTKCERCHHFEATSAIEITGVGVKMVCARCYGELKDLKVTEEEPNASES